MTEHEFLEELRNLANQPETTVDIDQEFLRLHVRNGSNYSHECPLSAIATTKTGQRYTIGQWMVAAQDLRVSKQLAIEIANAADDECPTQAERILRQKLLQACNITAE